MAANGECEGQIWSGAGKTQDELMLKDECILVNYMDEVIGHNNKYNCHKFVPGQPRGLLHRAFSVLLFDHENRLLLQQRAKSKITFPLVWTNTCCSHPLYGMKPCEVDQPEAIAQGDPKGVKAAAVRKLGHELGIPAAELDASRFKFLTRVHYWAADVGTYGSEAVWGEHEIDHILLYRLNAGEQLSVKPNAEEVEAVRWLGSGDLKEAMAGKGDMPLWSPWFRIIKERLLDAWWQDLDTALTTDKYVDVTSIHRFDTAPEFHGGLGDAKPLLDEVSKAEAAALKEGGEAQRRKVALDAEHEDRIVGFVGRGKAEVDTSAGDVKQGGYGKVPTHKIPKLDQLMRPLEIISALRLKCTGLLENNIKGQTDEDIEFCDDMLGKVSRSFAAVIRQLPTQLSIDICIFYLVLRALDTVEDDMEAYKGRESDKQAELISFGEKRLTDPNCSITGVGAADERTLVENFGRVARVFAKLSEGSREVIRNITDKMGAGMAEYVSADLAQGTLDQAAYNRYCHMVAGLVGEGLTRIFVSSGMESSELAGQGEQVWSFCADPKKEAANLGLANSMGLFLQKTNIIRDYLEDYVDGRAFWPQSVWKSYANSNDLGEFALPTSHGAGKLLPVKAGGEVLAKGAGAESVAMAKDLVDWISRQAQISGDARQDLVRVARRHAWEMQNFAEIICGEPSQNRDLIDVCSPFEIAVLSRAWRMDFGIPSPRKGPRRQRPAERDHLEERQHYIGGHSHMYLLDDYVAADEECQNRPSDVKVVPRVREAWPDNNRYHRDEDKSDKRSVVVHSAWNNKAPGRCPACGTTFLPEDRFCRTCGRRRVSWSDEGPAPANGDEKTALEELREDQETLDHPQREARAASMSLDDALAVAAGTSAIFVAGRGGLKRFELPDLQLTAAAPYAGSADPPGYADLAAGPDFVVCVDLDGCLFRYDSRTCELQAKRAYQPSVVEHSQRIVASQLERLSKPIVGLEGGFGGTSRVAANSKSVYLGGRDGVVTSYSSGSLSLTGRCRLQEGPASAAIGIRAVFLSQYQRLYCAVLSSVYVLATPGMYELARLRGGPRVPVFGSVGAVVESPAGDLVFVADVGGPSIHLWSTKSWQWMARVELPQGGPARHLAAPAAPVLYASTDAGRLMAFDYSRIPPLCIREGPGGGPLSVAESALAVLSQGTLELRPYL